MQTAKNDAEATHVYCYSGSTYAEAPRALDWEGKHHIVSRIEASWRTPKGPAFQVQTKPGNWFVLHYHEAKDQWTIKQLPKNLAPREA